ncbi:MAG: acylphosphatase [Halobacteriota archaeon]
MSELKRAIIIAEGKVQKAGYRDFVQDSARELGIAGYVENLEDGTVKIVCEGEEPKIGDFIRDIKVKKDFIDVSETSVKYEEPTGEFKLFKIKYGDVPEELGDRLGAALPYLGATNQKIDAGFKMLGGKMDRMLEKQDVMIEKQDDTIEEIKSLREDLKTYMANKFAKIEYEIEGIKAKIGMV